VKNVGGMTGKIEIRQQRVAGFFSLSLGSRQEGVAIADLE
jgi:hypothetical protein